MASIIRQEPRTVTRIVRGEAATDGAGVKLNRVVGTRTLGEVDPFLMLDEFGSDDPNAYIAGFPDHPHRGFETITYMLAGRMRHRDNRGNDGLLEAGDVQWMTAARGIVHSEMPEQTSGLMRGFQLWLNLPAAEKMAEARWRDIKAAELPVVTLGDATVTLIAGELGGARGPVAPPSTDPLIWDVALDGSVELPVPASHQGFAYVFEGEVRIEDRTVARGDAAVLGAGDVLRMSGHDARVLLVAGRPIGEPIARYGPFVMNSPQEIQQAFADFRDGRF